MGQVLRITYGDKDYRYQLLNETPIERDTQELRISLEGRSLTLVKKGDQWLPLETEAGGDNALINAVAKAITLRYRI